jgi:hypothetical protein
MAIVNTTMENNNQIISEKKVGGVREGAGRPLGSKQKLSGAALLEALEDTLGVPYSVQLANNYLNALATDRGLVAKYDQLFLNKVVADKVDITTNGQALQQPTLNFAPKEIPDYIEVTPINVQQS